MSEQANPPFETTELAAAMRDLATLNPADGKAAMMNKVDGAVARVMKVLNHGDPILVQSQEHLQQIRFVLTVMEQCKDFRDAKFTRLVRQRVEDIQTGLENLPKRAKQAADQKKKAEAEAAAKAKAEAMKAKAQAKQNANPITQAEPEAPKKPEFQYELAEKICVQSIVRHYDAKLDCLRSVHMHGRHSTVELGIAPHFLYTIEFSVLIEDAIKALLKDSREIMTRRVYTYTQPDDDEEKIRKDLREQQRGLMEVVRSGFSGWGSAQTEAEKAAHAPKKKQVAKTEKKGGLFSKLLGKNDKKEERPQRPVKKEKQVWELVREGWKEAEKRGEIYFPPTFNFSILTYLVDLNESIFNSEVARVVQIAEQNKGGSAAKGAVARALNQVFKNNDQTFFELVILNLLYTKNNIGLDEVQSACMGQKLDASRLPLTVPEMGRRPRAYSHYIIKILGEWCEPRVLEHALKFFFESVLVLHLKKYEDEFKMASSNLTAGKEKLPAPLQNVVDGVLGLIDRVMFAREEARESGEDTTRNTKDTIDHTIGKFMAAYKGMYEKKKGS